MKEKIYLSPPDLKGNEQALLQHVFASNWIAPSGPMLAEFEIAVAAYVKIPYAVALNSATAGIHLGLQVLGVKKGDKVLCATFTFVASLNPIRYVGAEPVLIDAEVDSWNICPELLEKAIVAEIAKGQKPKALVLVHGYGMPAKLDEILKITKAYGILVLEDAASALGATYNDQFCGTFGDVGVFSFNGNKIITTSGGGMLVSKQEKYIEQACYLASQAKENTTDYQHHVVGYNYRLSNVLAAIGVGQLAYLPSFIQKRRANNEYYKTRLQKLGVLFLEERAGMYSNYWLTSVLFHNFEQREAVREILESNTIESRPLWRPMHQQKMYEKAIFYKNGTSEDLYARGLSLPSGTSLTTQNLDRICTLIETVLV